MRKISLEQIFKIGILIIALIFLLFYFQASQNGRYQFLNGRYQFLNYYSVIDTRDGTIYDGLSSINIVKVSKSNERESMIAEMKAMNELRIAEEKAKTETKEMNIKRKELLDAGFDNKEIDEYFAEEDKKGGKP